MGSPPCERNGRRNILWHTSAGSLLVKGPRTISLRFRRHRCTGGAKVDEFQAGQSGPSALSFGSSVTANPGIHSERSGSIAPVQPCLKQHRRFNLRSVLGVAIAELIRGCEGSAWSNQTNFPSGGIADAVCNLSLTGCTPKVISFIAGVNTDGQLTKLAAPSRRCLR